MYNINNLTINEGVTIAGALIIMLITQKADFAWHNKFIDTFLQAY